MYFVLSAHSLQKFKLNSGSHKGPFNVIDLLGAAKLEIVNYLFTTNLVFHNDSYVLLSVVLPVSQPFNPSIHRQK